MTDLLASRYQLVRVLGQGAMGVVWLAQDTVLDRPIAIKELRPAPGVDASEATERFLVEARAAARLSHPNIVGIHDVFVDGERVLIAMELVEGPTLEEVLRSSGAQPPEVVRAIMAQVAQALAVAHQAGVIHRDLKPDNIFWTPDGRAVVTDFGLARIGAGRGTVEGTIMGTPGYMAPEQVRGTPTGPQSDIFAWGAVAYTLLTGQAPFGEPSITDPTALAYRIVHEDAPPLVIPDDPALAELITRCLAKDPTRRPGDGGELVGGLLAGTRGTLVSTTHPPEAATNLGTPKPAAGNARTPPLTSERQINLVPVVLFAFGLLCVALVTLLASRDEGSPSVTEPTTVGAEDASSAATTIVVMPMGSGPATSVPRLTALPTPTSPPTPTGRIVVSRGSLALVVVNADGTGETTLAAPGGAQSPAWSPDRNQLAFDSRGGDNGDPLGLFVMSADGTNVRQLTEEYSPDPQWSPDGRYLAFAMPIDNQMYIHVIRVDGTGLRPLTRGVEPSWSPDGTRLAFAAYNGASLKNDLYVIDADGTNLMRVTSREGEESQPRWDPIGGNFLLYAGDEGIILMNIDGSGKRTLSEQDLRIPAPYPGPTWSPDGMFIAFSRYHDSHGELWIMRRDGSEQIQLTEGGEVNDVSPSWG